MTPKILIEQGKPYLLPECPEEPDLNCGYCSAGFTGDCNCALDADKYQAALKSTKRIEFADHPLLDFYVKDGLHEIPTGYTVVVETVLSDGWVPTYNDPDNKGGHPNAEPVEVAILKPLPEEKEAPEYQPDSRSIGDAATVIRLLSKYIHGESFGRRRDAIDLCLQNARDAFDRLLSTVEKEPQEEQHIFQSYKDEVQVGVQRILRDQGCASKEVYDAIDDTLNSLRKHFTLTRKGE